MIHDLPPNTESSQLDGILIRDQRAVIQPGGGGSHFQEMALEGTIEFRYSMIKSDILDNVLGHHWFR